jgi:long-chain acyl-CoA synthetase
MQLPDLSRYDTTAKLLLHNAAHWGTELALREKEYGIWRVYTWADSRTRVEELARGLLALGVAPGDVVGIIGRNRPHWLWAELAAHAIGAMSLGIYEDALGKEVAYLLGLRRGQAGVRRGRGADRQGPGDRRRAAAPALDRLQRSARHAQI